MKSIVVGAIIAPLMLGVLSGCLQTRNDVRENEHRNVMLQQVSTLQKNNADVANRFAEFEEQLRAMNGRVEVVENKVDQSQSIFDGVAKQNKDQSDSINEKMMLLQEALEKMEKEISVLSSDLQALKAPASPSAKHILMDKQNISLGSKDSFEVAQEHFMKKDWKQAILKYQKYREEKPKGPRFGDATYKIGVSFQELGMSDESKTFYDEVINKFPKSDEARRAKIRLKSLRN
jgi:TolA-binding protein